MPHTQLEREISASGEARPGLAPDEQSSLLPAPGELAGWLQLVNPPGEHRVGVAEASAANAGACGAAREVAQLLDRWVRRVGLGGDSRRGVARLEIGAGRFAGGELLVIAEAGHVSVELELPTVAPRGLAERLRERLERRGLGAEVTVR